jgi:lysozyme
LKTSKKGIQVIKEFEGCKLKSYQDIVGVWTIGYGFTKGVSPNDTMTQTECEERLLEELASYEQAVHEGTGGEYTQNQFDAMVSLAWNIGIAGFRKSSVLKAHVRGDYQAAARAFGLWNKAGGKVVAGLTRRRAAESVLYLTPEAYEPKLDMPQRVDEERPMTSSTINRAGVIAGGTATIAGVSQTIDTVNNLKYSIASLGDWLVPALLVLTIVSVGYIIYERVMQRKNGWV